MPESESSTIQRAKAYATVYLRRFTSHIVPKHRRDLDQINAELATGPWHAPGFVISHYAPSLFSPATSCLGVTWRGVSSDRVPTLIGVVCPVCLYERFRAAHRAKRQEAAGT